MADSSPNKTSNFFKSFDLQKLLWKLFVLVSNLFQLLYK